MRKMIAVVLLAVLVINVAYPAFEQGGISAMMAPSDMSCTIGGAEGIDCDRVLTICLAVASGFWETLACLALWAACKILVE